MNEADGFFPERLVLRQRMAHSQAEGEPVDSSGPTTGDIPTRTASTQTGTSPGFSPWMWFVIFMPAWMGGGAGWHFARGAASNLKDTLLKDVMSAGFDALAALGLGLAGLWVYLAFKAWARGRARG